MKKVTIVGLTDEKVAEILPTLVLSRCDFIVEHMTDDAHPGPKKEEMKRLPPPKKQETKKEPKKIHRAGNGSTIPTSVVAILRQSGARTKRQLAAAVASMGWKEGSVDTAIQTMLKEGKLNRLPDGLIIIAEGAKNGQGEADTRQQQPKTETTTSD